MDVSVTGRVVLGLAFNACLSTPPRPLDDARPRDATLPTPRFVKSHSIVCSPPVRLCEGPIKDATPGHFFIVTVAYDSPTDLNTVVRDGSGAQLAEVFPPEPLVASTNERTGLWWHRSESPSKITVELGGDATSYVLVIANEFVATAIDQWSSGRGTAIAGAILSSGPKTIENTPQLIFGHGHANNTLLTAQDEFTPHWDDDSDVRAASRLVSEPGPYEARFKTTSATPWVVLMVTLR